MIWYDKTWHFASNSSSICLQNFILVYADLSCMQDPTPFTLYRTAGALITGVCMNPDGTNEQSPQLQYVQAWRAWKTRQKNVHYVPTVRLSGYTWKGQVEKWRFEQLCLWRRRTCDYGGGESQEKEWSILEMITVLWPYGLYTTVLRLY